MIIDDADCPCCSLLPYMDSIFPQPRMSVCTCWKNSLRAAYLPSLWNSTSTFTDIFPCLWFQQHRLICGDAFVLIMLEKQRRARAAPWPPPPPVRLGLRILPALTGGIWGSIVVDDEAAISKFPGTLGPAPPNNRKPSKCHGNL